MLGHILFVEERGRRPRVEVRRVRGMSVLTALVPTRDGPGSKALAYRVDKAARLLVKQGVRRALVPQDFAHWGALRSRGIAGVDPTPLCAALAPSLALAALPRLDLSPHQVTVALRGGRVSRPFFQAALALAPLVRGVVISSPNGGEALSAHLREEFGVPILEEWGEADLTVDFTPMPGGAGRTMKLYGEPDLLGVELFLREGDWPEQFEVLPLAAALWEGGCLALDDLVSI